MRQSSARLLFRSLTGPTRTLGLVALSVVLSAVSLVPASAEPSHQILLPIAPDRLDDVYWSDTWGAARSGGRSHIGVDMMGPKMVPLRAVAEAEVTWGRFNNSRGSIVRLRADDGWEYQYIHINNDTPGTDDGAATCTQALSARLCEALEPDGDITRGTRVSAGEIIGYLGDSGNAEWTGAHLHFEIYAPTGDGDGGVVAVNPTPYVDAAAARVRAGEDETTSRGWTEAEKADLVTRAVEEIGSNPEVARIDRLYLGFFLRAADERGLDQWTSRHANGQSLASIAEEFAQSPEFQQRYGHLDFGDFLDQLYIDVLHRRPDENGKWHWLRRLESGYVDRGTIVAHFTESPELRGKSAERAELVVLARFFDRGVPSGAHHAAWAETRVDLDLETAIELWFLGETPLM